MSKAIVKPDSPIAYVAGRLHVERVALEDVAARHGTPCYVYSLAQLERNWRAFDRALAARAHLVCYAVKANSNGALLRRLAGLGSGFDIVSEGELHRVLRAGGRADRVVFSGVGKSASELRAALEAGIRCFNVESGAELERLNRLAEETRKTAPVALRVNPEIDPHTHPYIATALRDSKFGIPYGRALEHYRRAAQLPGLRVEGAGCHIGSQIVGLEPFRAAARRMRELADTLDGEGIALRHIDLGGGLGIRYRDEPAPTPEEYVHALDEALGAGPWEIRVAPGRAVAGSAGILLTRVEYVKPGAERDFAVVDAAMNDLLRPALYDAWHDVWPVRERPGKAGRRRCDVVGPVCESGDFLGRDRELAVAEGDLLAVFEAGAYGAAMGSNYNSRPRPCEVLVDGERMHVVRRRETLDDLTSHECLLAAP